MLVTDLKYSKIIGIISPWQFWDIMMPSSGILFGDYEGVFKRSNQDGGEEFGDRHLGIYQSQPGSFADSNTLISSLPSSSRSRPFKYTSSIAT